MKPDAVRVVVTGGGAGIGRAIAEAFLSQGAHVAICDADPDAVAAFASAYPDAIARTADVTVEAEMADFLGDVEGAWGGADVVCANAGTGGPAGAIEQLDYGAWQACVATNVHGSFLTCRWAARVMRAAGSGLMVLTASTAGQMGYPYRSPYAVAKWGVIGLMKTLAMELGDAGVRVNAICPGPVRGPRMEQVIANEAAARQVPEQVLRDTYAKTNSMGVWIDPEDIAATVLFLASPAGAKISGQTIAVDGNTEFVSPPDAGS